jgi:predicted AlkP superfamily pyrophosphatase or phosphodiesterase
MKDGSRFSRHLAIIQIIAANLLIPLSIVIFAKGFFPYKPFLPGLADYEPLSFGTPPDAPFDKLIFMVVDALRRYVFLPSMNSQSNNREKGSKEVLIIR